MPTSKSIFEGGGGGGGQQHSQLNMLLWQECVWLKRNRASHLTFLLVGTSQQWQNSVCVCACVLACVSKGPKFRKSWSFFFFSRYLLSEQVFCLFVHPVFYEPVFVLGHKIVVWTCLEPQTAKVSISCAAGMKAVCFKHCQNGRGGVFCVHVCMCMYMWEEEVAGGA